MNITHWLNKPYPLIERTKNKILISASFGLFVYIFLLVYQPFGSHQVGHNKSLFFLGFGACVFIGLLLNYLILPHLFPKLFNPEKWQVRKEIIFILCCFTLITLLNFTYNSIFGETISEYRNLLEFSGITVSIGIFPVIILFFLNERNLDKKNILKAKELYKTISSPNSEIDTLVSIEPETLKSKSLKLNLKDFIFAISDNNYVTLFYLKENNLQRKLLRLSLKNLENQLINFENIIRCHRSYLVNKENIKNVKGNARSLTLEMKGYHSFIPVSRSFSKKNLI